MSKRGNKLLSKLCDPSPDVFGKMLRDFEKQPESIDEETPLIFQLLAGYYRSKEERFKVIGSFRVTSGDGRLRELELHLSQGNYPFLETIEDANLVANHWKRIFREMAEPLFPENLYDKFSKVIEI